MSSMTKVTRWVVTIMSTVTATPYLQQHSEVSGQALQALQHPPQHGMQGESQGTQVPLEMLPSDSYSLMAADELLWPSHLTVHVFQAGDKQQLRQWGAIRIAKVHRCLEAHHHQHGQRGKQPVDLRNEDLQAATRSSGRAR